MHISTGKQVGFTTSCVSIKGGERMKKKPKRSNGRRKKRKPRSQERLGRRPRRRKTNPTMGKRRKTRARGRKMTR